MFPQPLSIPFWIGRDGKGQLDVACGQGSSGFGIKTSGGLIFWDVRVGP